jgi:hypothetical protein
VITDRLEVGPGAGTASAFIEIKEVLGNRLQTRRKIVDSPGSVPLCNSTLYKTGENAGNKQVFLTPGLGFGRMRLGKNLRFSSAAGMQIAATRFHTYNHRWMFSTRVSF